jgi:hypothetical protein
MLTETAPNQACDGSPDPLDVVVLVVPQNASPAQIIDVITRASTRDHTAVLVVLPHRSNAGTPARRRDDSADDDDDRLDALWRSRCTRR